MVPRIDKFAQKYKIMVGFHNHDMTSDPEEFSTRGKFRTRAEGRITLRPD